MLSIDNHPRHHIYIFNLGAAFSNALSFHSSSPRDTGHKPSQSIQEVLQAYGSASSPPWQHRIHSTMHK